MIGIYTGVPEFSRTKLNDEQKAPIQNKTRYKNDVNPFPKTFPILQRRLEDLCCELLSAVTNSQCIDHWKYSCNCHFVLRHGVWLNEAKLSRNLKQTILHQCTSFRILFQPPRRMTNVNTSAFMIYAPKRTFAQAITLIAFASRRSRQVQPHLQMYVQHHKQKCNKCRATMLYSLARP